MDAALRQLVRDRAADRCEYCLLPQSAAPFFTFHIEHIIAKQHGGTDDPQNLAEACPDCNRFKGPNLAGRDEETGDIVRLFHPRTDQWVDHFRVVAAEIIGITPIGRATAKLLNMNEPERMAMRAELIASRDY